MVTARWPLLAVAAVVALLLARRGRAGRAGTIARASGAALIFIVLALAFSHDPHRHGGPLVRDQGPADPASIERGARLFATACATCHGRTGGGGPGAPGLSPPPADLTFHVPLHSDGEIFRSISEGVRGTAMPVWSERLTEQQLWALVSFLRAEFSRTGAATPEE